MENRGSPQSVVGSSEVEQKWKSGIGDCVVNGQLDEAKKMSEIKPMVLDFVRQMERLLGV
ncbi:hypothetical protein M3Y99_01151400 [Aphelenchoides fujianensis]|nr:hypothetical protein M3Y99_01151400 [Aphelenchoides fujianensis]